MWHPLHLLFVLLFAYFCFYLLTTCIIKSTRSAMACRAMHDLALSASPASTTLPPYLLLLFLRHEPQVHSDLQNLINSVPSARMALSPVYCLACSLFKSLSNVTSSLITQQLLSCFIFPHSIYHSWNCLLVCSCFCQCPFPLECKFHEYGDFVLFTMCPWCLEQYQAAGPLIYLIHSN